MSDSFICLVSQPSTVRRIRGKTDISQVLATSELSEAPPSPIQHPTKALPLVEELEVIPESEHSQVGDILSLIVMMLMEAV